MSDGFGYVMYPGGALGTDVQTVPAVVTCPQCSYLSGGSCAVCMTSDDHPSCGGCENGAVVWYRRPMFVSIVTAVAVSLVAGVVVKQIQKRSKLFG